MDDKIKKLIKFIAKKAEQESFLLYPDPAWNINVHLLLDEIAKLYELDAKTIDDIITSKQ